MPIDKQDITPFHKHESPEITELHYDLRILRLTLSFPGVDEPVYVSFKDVIGFSVLDEGDLLEFWSQSSENKGWIWRIIRGGWMDLENTRDGFVTGKVNPGTEFLVAGINDCCRVISFSEPIVERIV